MACGYTRRSALNPGCGGPVRARQVETLVRVERQNLRRGVSEVGYVDELPAGPPIQAHRSHGAQAFLAELLRVEWLPATPHLRPKVHFKLLVLDKPNEQRLKVNELPRSATRVENHEHSHVRGHFRNAASFNSSRRG
jgi:hypothetical protein